MIIAIEGGDACGKHTQSTILAEKLGALLFAFPDYTTPAGVAITGNLKSEWQVCRDWDDPDLGRLREEAKQTNALVLQSLMLTNRMERGAELRTAATRGHVVLDRYDASARVYGTLDGLDPKWLADTNAQLPVRPDVYVLLDAPVDEGFRRRPERRDRYEKDREYLERVRVAYLKLFQEEQEAAIERHMGDGQTRNAYQPGPRWHVVNAVGTVEQVAERVWSAVR